MSPLYVTTALAALALAVVFFRCLFRAGAGQDPPQKDQGTPYLDIFTRKN